MVKQPPIFYTNKFPEDDKKKRPYNTDGNFLNNTIDYYQPPFLNEMSGNSPDGTLSLYNPDGEDRKLFDTVDQEVIFITSDPLWWSKLDRDRTETDIITGEAPVRYYSKPVEFKGSYEDAIGDINLSAFGLDQIASITIYCNYNWVLRKFDDAPKTGDLIFLHDGRIMEIMASYVNDPQKGRPQHWVLETQTAQTDNYIIETENGEMNLSYSQLKDNTPDGFTEYEELDSELSDLTEDDNYESRWN